MTQTYKTQIIEGCTVIFGSIPIREVSALCLGFSNNAVMDLHLASLMGACMVLGEPAAIDKLNNAPPESLPISQKRRDESQQASDAGYPKLAAWLLTGKRGLSSDALSKAIYGIPASAGVNHPMDASDFNRCVKFMEMTESSHQLDFARGLSGHWAGLIASWGLIADALQEDAEGGQSMARADKLIRSELEL